MGKKDKKKSKNRDPDKRAEVQARKENKANKKAQKRELKAGSEKKTEDDGGTGAGEDDLDAYLQEYRQRSKELSTPTLEELGGQSGSLPMPFPPRSNASLTSCHPLFPDVVLFGGEYYDGAQNIVLDELYRWNPDVSVLADPPSTLRPEKKPAATAADSEGDESDDDDDEEEEEEEEEKEEEKEEKGDPRHVASEESKHGSKQRKFDVGRWRRVLCPEPRPAARNSHSAVHHNGSVYVFGGEFTAGERFHHYRDLWKFDLRTNTWEELSSSGYGGKKKQTTAASPSERSGHRAIVWRHFMIVVGGFHETANREATRWYDDVWLFDFQTHLWSEVQFGKFIVAKPPPRSAFSFGIYSAPSTSSAPTDDILFIYGGYSKDLTVQHHIQSDAASSPSSFADPRGISSTERRRSEAIVHADCWALNLRQVLDSLSPPDDAQRGQKQSRPTIASASSTRGPTWERIARGKGECPSLRSGTSSWTYRDKMMMFGGVFDQEGDNHRMTSVFFDDLYAFDMARRKWFRVNAQGNASPAQASGSTANEERASRPRRRRKSKQPDNGLLKGVADDVPNSIDGEDEGNPSDIDDDQGAVADDEKDEEVIGGMDDNEVPSAGWDLKTVKANMFSFVDGKGRVIYERMDADKDSDEDELEDGEEKDEEKDISDNEKAGSRKKSTAGAASWPNAGGKTMAREKLSSPTPPSPSVIVERTSPLPRINAAVTVRGSSTLIVYGGIIEVGDREVTLDDCWSLDLSRPNKGWNCVWPGTMHRQVWRGDESDTESRGSTDRDKISDVASEDDRENSDTMPGRNDDAETKEIESLMETLELSSSCGRESPNVGESLADFYSRTAENWNEQARTGDGNVDAPLSSKEVKRKGFLLAKERYEELQPTLEKIERIQRRSVDRNERPSRRKGDSENSQKSGKSDQKKKDRRR